MTCPTISFTLGRRLGMVVYITEKSLWAGPTREKREELVGGTHPWLVSLWLVLVGGTHPGGKIFLKKDLVCKLLGHSPSRHFISALAYTLHVRAHCSIGIPIPGLLALHPCGLRSGLFLTVQGSVPSVNHGRYFTIMPYWTRYRPQLFCF